jgi:hypothetical protein
VIPYHEPVRSFVVEELVHDNLINDDVAFEL